MNKNNEMKAILGESLELMIRDIAFDYCSYIEEDEDKDNGKQLISVIHMIVSQNFMRQRLYLASNCYTLYRLNTN